MIQLRNLEKSYKTKAGFTYVLRQINLDINEGDFVTFMGPSGAGKSTLFRLLLGVLGPSAGASRVLGKPSGELDAETRGRIGLVPVVVHQHATGVDPLEDVAPEAVHGRLADLRQRDPLRLADLAAAWIEDPPRSRQRFTLARERATEIDPSAVPRLVEWLRAPWRCLMKCVRIARSKSLRAWA